MSRQIGYIPDLPGKLYKIPGYKCFAAQGSRIWLLLQLSLKNHKKSFKLGIILSPFAYDLIYRVYNG